MMYSIEVLGAFDFLAEEVKIGVRCTVWYKDS